MPTLSQILDQAIENVIEVVQLLPQAFPYIHFENINLTLTHQKDHYIMTCELLSTIRITQLIKKQIKSFISSELKIRQRDVTLHAIVLLGISLNHNDTIKMIHHKYFI